MSSPATTSPARVCRPALRCVAGTAVAALLVLASARPAHAHGSPFVVGWNQAANQITVSPSVYRNFSIAEMLVFDPEFNVFTNTGEPGFDRGSSLPSATAISLEVTGPLWFWHPGIAAEDPLPEPQGILDVVGGGIARVSATGVTGDNPVAVGFLTTHHHVNWELSNADAAAGLYGITARLRAGQPQLFSAAPSEEFLIVLNRGITDSQVYNTGVDRLAVAVPEPGVAALLTTALIAGLAWRLRARGERQEAGDRSGRGLTPR
jgi:hypothetical protein